MSRKRILVVDDQKDTQVLLKKCLEAVGYDVKQAWDGKDGLWKVLEHKPDFILVDVIMPEMNGIEFVHRLRDIDKGHRIPMIVISKPALIAHLFDEGVIEGFFPKPIDVKGLILKIDEVFRRNDIAETVELAKSIKAEGMDAVISAGNKNRIKREICQRCANVVTETEGPAECCPACGYPGFYVEDISG